VLVQVEKTLEPCTLLSYLFDLCSAVNSANKALYIKDQSPEIQEARLLLFESAKVVLRSGLEMLGLVPLERM
jgi:arginyl-tRNA synthetase